MSSRLVPGTSVFCRMVRLTGEGATGDGCTWALTLASAANATRAAQAAMVLNMSASLLIAAGALSALTPPAPESSRSVRSHSNSIVEQYARIDHCLARFAQ